MKKTATEISQRLEMPWSAPVCHGLPWSAIMTACVEVYSQTYTGHMVQKMGCLRIFHTFRHVCGVWKIAKNDNCLTKFCSVCLGNLT